MKPNTRSIASILALAILLIAGCVGTPNRVAFQAASVDRLTVEEGLGLYNVWIKSQHAKGVNTAAQDTQVQNAFEKWKAAQIAVLEVARLNSVATSTNAAGQTGLSAALQDAIDRASQLRVAFLSLLTQFGVNLTGTPAPAVFTPLK